MPPSEIVRPPSHDAPVTDSSTGSAQPNAPLAAPSRPRKRLAVATAVVFAVSLAFPVTAALSRSPSSFPQWWGPLDVAIAFLLAIMAMALLAITGRVVTQRAQDATYRTYRVLLHGVLGLVVVFFLFDDRIIWRYGLLGLAWRTWLLLYGLPAWYTALETPSPTPRGP